jgi:hypothetical protein
MSGFASIGHILKDLTGSAPWGEGIRRYEVVGHWEKAVGPAVARRAVPVEVRGRTLYVQVRDSVWLQQLVFLSENIRQALNDAVGREALERIFFRLADQAESPASLKQDGGVEELERRRARLSAQAPDRKTVQTALSQISDPEVRDAFESLLARAEKIEL